MRRGVIKLNKEEVAEIFTHINLEKISTTPLYAKLNAALEHPEPEVNIEVSEDEVEDILDQIAVPDPANDNPAIKSLREKIYLLLANFRTESA